jgi:hypothetical protein
VFGPAWSRIKELNMSQQAKIDALEHLLIAVLKKNSMTLPADAIFDAAHASIMGSNGPGGTTQKTEAMDALRNLKTLLS